VFGRSTINPTVATSEGVFEQQGAGIYPTVSVLITGDDGSTNNLHDNNR
jgi:hypothetical protein